MPSSKIWWTIIIIGFGCIGFYQFSKFIPLSLSSSRMLFLRLSTRTSSSTSSTTTTSTSSTTTSSATILPSTSYTVVQMDDRVPFYKLAANDAGKPYADGDRAQATVIKYLNLVKACKSDPSLIVVDVGALLGDFGLYAAACGCQVFIFEVQPRMVDLIRTSIVLNKFSTSRVHIMQNAVSDLPSNSNLTFSIEGGLTKVSEGSLRVPTIRLDDVEWPPGSSILLLKVDVEGSELNVLRSAEKLFREKRIHHLIFEYTAWWTDRAAQKDLIPFVEKTLGAKRLYALGRMVSDVYGPLTREVLDEFHENHVKRHIQTDIYAMFVESICNCTIEAQPYSLKFTYA